MPSFADVGSYLDANRLEEELSEAVAELVEEERPQPLAALAERLLERAAATSLDWDYVQLTASVRALIDESQCGPELVHLSFADAAIFSAALHPNGQPNAALRFADGGEGTFAHNATLATKVAPLLEPIKQCYPHISRADLWAHAANVAIEAMGGPAIHTRFGRRDAASSAEGVQSAKGRLPEHLSRGEGDERTKADHLRAIFHPKGFSDRDIVVLCGRHTVGRFEAEGGHRSAWTERPDVFDNGYFVALLNQKYEPAACGSAGLLLRCAETGTIMLPTDVALLRDARFRVHVEKFATDAPAFFEAFSHAWARLQELGCHGLRLQPHPSSLTYASSCYLPCEWVELRLITRTEHTHDTTIYGFGLPDDRPLNLPACSCVLIKVAGKGRKARDGHDGADAVRPYVPITEPEITGRFELLVKRYDGGVVSQHLHGLQIGSRVAFKHVHSNLRAQYPFAGKGSVTMLAAGSGITPIIQALHKILFTPGDERKVVLLYGNKTVEDILLKERLDEWARALPHRLTIVHVIGGKPDEAPPAGWRTTDSYVAEVGWIDRKKIEKYAFPPAKDALVLVCGSAALYASLCGPRDEASVREGSVLDQLGYSSGMVAKM